MVQHNVAQITCFTVGFSQVSPTVHRALCTQVVAEHLYHEGHFDIGDVFVEEAGVPDGQDLKQPYARMPTVLEALQRRDLAPALDWVRANAAALAGLSGGLSGLEFSIHKVAFLQLLKEQGQAAALRYGRQHFPRFQASHMPQIQRLLGALCYSRRAAAGRQTPYADLFSLEELWLGLQTNFVRQCCALLGQAQDSPLLVRAGAWLVRTWCLRGCPEGWTGQWWCLVVRWWWWGNREVFILPAESPLSLYVLLLRPRKGAALVD